MIDLRSDTVTRPSPEMRAAIANCEVGDDVIDVDPTIDRLEKTTAELLGHEAAIYMPSGSMTNQIAIRLHCRPGDEFICEEDCHIYNYEQAAFAQLSGIVARTVIGDCGVLRLDDVQDKIRPINDHMVRTRLLCLENTHNRAGGRVQPYETLRQTTDWARENGLVCHLDGARLFNAVVASGIEASQWARHFDTVSVCFSKGLGAPVGSALVGPRELIREARRHRKVFGGAMRQAGIIAAGALYALENNIARLAEDHEKARVLAASVRQSPGISLIHEHMDTNMVIFRVDAKPNAASEFRSRLVERGVDALTTSPHHLRLVTHLDVSHEQVARAAKIVAEVADEFIGASIAG